MPKLLEIEDPERLKAAAQELFTANEDARFVRRLDVMLVICQGQPLGRTADLFGVNPTTVQRWIHRLNRFGLEGLKDKPGRGRPPRLTQEDLERLRQDLESEPRSFGYEAARWDGKLLSHHLRTNYRTDLKVRQCQYLFKKLGFSLQRPRKMPVGADPEKRKAFKKTSPRDPSKPGGGGSFL